MPTTQDPDVPLNVLADERARPAFFKLARACITLARLGRNKEEPSEREVRDSPKGAS